MSFSYLMHINKQCSIVVEVPVLESEVKFNIYSADYCVMLLCFLMFPSWFFFFLRNTNSYLIIFFVKIVHKQLYLMVPVGNHISSGGRGRKMTNSRHVWATGDFKTSLFYSGNRSLKIKKKRKTGECGLVSWLLCMMS